MRLLYVCTDFGIPPDGTKGASVHLREITRALIERDHEVRLLSPLEGPGSGHPVARLLRAGCSPVKRSTRMLKQWLLSRDLDGTVAAELRPLLYNAWVLEGASRAGRAFRPDAIIERLSLFGHVGVDLAGALGVPLLVEVNALISEEARDFRGLALQRLAEQIEQRTLSHADAIVTVSAALRERMRERCIASEKIHVVPNGVDLKRFENLPPRSSCRRDLNIENEQFVVGFCGSLKVWHGVDLLLEAFGKLHHRDSSGRLLIVGSGPCEDTLRKTVQDMNMSNNVIFTGSVPHDQVPRLLRTMDVAVAPFRSMEHFYFSPIKLFEYMAAGTCVVASRLGQIQDVIRDQANGLLCPPDDAQALTETLDEARRSPQLRQRLADAAEKTVRERYTWSRAAETVTGLAQALCSKKRQNPTQTDRGAPGRAVEVSS